MEQGDRGLTLRYGVGNSGGAAGQPVVSTSIPFQSGMVLFSMAPPVARKRRPLTNPASMLTTGLPSPVNFAVASGCHFGAVSFSPAI